MLRELTLLHCAAAAAAAALLPCRYATAPPLSCFCALLVERDFRYPPMSLLALTAMTKQVEHLREELRYEKERSNQLTTFIKAAKLTVPPHLPTTRLKQIMFGPRTPSDVWVIIFSYLDFNSTSLSDMGEVRLFWMCRMFSKLCPSRWC